MEQKSKMSGKERLESENNDLKLIIRDLLTAMEEIARGNEAQSIAKQSYAKALTKYHMATNRNR